MVDKPFSGSFTQPSVSLRHINFLILLLLSTLLPATLTSAQLRSDTKNLTLSESQYESSIESISDAQEKSKRKFTIGEFISGVVDEGSSAGSVSSGGDSGEGEDLSSVRYFGTGFNWDSDDEKNFSTWEPIAVTTWEDSAASSSASSTDAIKDAMIILWRDTTVISDDSPVNYGMRITIISSGAAAAASDSKKKYQHVLLVENPSTDKSGKVEFDLLSSVERSGVVWFGDWLYVGNGKSGFRAFDMSHIWQMVGEDGDEEDEERQKELGGMKFVLPQARTYKIATKFPPDWSTFTFSFLSLDTSTSPPAILVGEYEAKAGYATYTAKWRLVSATGRLETKNSIATAIWAWRMGDILRVRGMVYAAKHEQYFIAVEPEDDNAQVRRNGQGELWIWKPVTGNTLASETDTASGITKNVLPRGIGGLGYSPKQDVMWVVGAGDASMKRQRGVVGLNVEGYFDDEGDINTAAPSTTVSSPTSTGTSTATSTSTSSTTTTTSAPEETGGSSEGEDDENKPSKTVLLGGILGGLVALGLVLSLILVCLRRHRRNQKLNQPSQDFQMQSSYPPHGFAHGQDDRYPQGEIPALKMELDGHATPRMQSSHGHGPGSVHNGSGVFVQEVSKQQAQIPQAPVYSRSPRVRDGPWVELPADDHGADKRFEMA